MRLGIVTPVVNLNPRFAPPQWESDGGIEDVVAVAKAAEALGYSWLTCSEHVAIPSAVAQTRGGRYWDPAVALSFVAARTKTIGLLTYVLVVGYHHPLEIVKRFGSLDDASSGRLILGLGVGSLEAEFDLLGASFVDRGTRADEAISAIRSAFGRRDPAFSGETIRFGDFVVDPCGSTTDVPIWIGGRTRRSLNRALRLGDGWIPFGLDRVALSSILEDAELRRRMSDKESFEVVLAPEPPLDPCGEQARTREVVRAYAQLGATALNVRVEHSSRAQYVDQLEALIKITAEVAGFE